MYVIHVDMHLFILNACTHIPDVHIYPETFYYTHTLVHIFVHIYTHTVFRSEIGF